MKELLMLLNFVGIMLAAVIGAVCLTSGEDVRETMNIALMGKMAIGMAVIGFINLMFVMDRRWKDYESERISHRVIMRPPLHSDE